MNVNKQAALTFSPWGFSHVKNSSPHAENVPTQHYFVATDSRCNLGLLPRTIVAGLK